MIYYLGICIKLLEMFMKLMIEGHWLYISNKLR